MKIYNSITRKKDEITERKVGIYVCGPTVYDESHIGHARSAYFFDCFVKYLKFRKFKVKFVRNVTDIDDKIIKKAQDEAGPRTIVEKVKKVSERYLKSYHEDLELLGLAKPDKEPKATEVIKDMIIFIEDLIKKGYAYNVSGSVYFEVRKFKPYGKLSHQAIDEMEEGARVSLDKNKKDPLDFALWKASIENEPSWKSPWGDGRPGWHIECSVMSTKFLGKDFLIHGGGLDLVFPHHENEIAQTVCAGKKSAKYWIHNGLLTINKQKMSKSLGNFVSIKDFIEEFKDEDFLKLLFLASHYRHPVDYNREKIQEVASMKERITIFFASAEKESDNKSVKKNKEKTLQIDSFKKEFIDAMDDDFNTPRALGVIFEMVKAGNTHIAQGDYAFARNIKKVVKDFSSIFGLKLDRKDGIKIDFKKEIENMIQMRNAARKNKDFKKADDIRDSLLEKGIILEDTKEGSKWRKKL